jgi:hypothetical protein
MSKLGILRARQRVAVSGGGYVAKAVHFDGLTAMTSTSLSVPATRELSVSFWFKPEYVAPPDGFGRTTACIFQGDGVLSGSTIYVGSPTLSPNGLLFIETCNADFSSYLEWQSVGPLPYDASGYTNLLINVSTASLDSSNMPTVFLSKAGSLDLPIPMVRTYTGGAPFDIDVFYDKFYFNDYYVSDANSSTIYPPIQDVSDTWIDSTHLDFTVETNRRKFVGADGKPVNLGADGSTPTGVAPAIFFSGDASTFGTNRGTGGGAFALVNGPLTTVAGPS